MTMTWGDGLSSISRRLSLHNKYVHKAIAANCPALVSLNVAECEALTDSCMKAIAANCPAIVSLNVAKCEALTGDAVKAIAADCPLLT